MHTKTLGILLFLSLIALSFNACKPKVKQEKDNSITAIVIPKEQPTEPKKEPIIPPINYDSNFWTNLNVLAPSIELDIRYATDNNFVGEPIYDCAGCYLRPEVAKALVKVNEDLIEQGYGGLKIFDCYRPRPYQQRLWGYPPNVGQIYLA